MSSRKERRMDAHKARKLARKAGFPPPGAPADNTASVPVPDPQEKSHSAQESAPFPPPIPNVPEPGFPFPSLSSMSAARLEANRANAKLSKGALTDETKAISAQNHTIHGLARHQNGTFKLLSSENPATFAALQQSLLDEHHPATPTEVIFVHRMVESDWLAQRAQRLQDTCLDPDSGEVKDEKKFSLYVRYQTTHIRAFHKCLNDLAKLRKERRQTELGVEAQRANEEAQQVETERHQMKKDKHYWETLRLDAFACQQLSVLAEMNHAARQNNPNFQAEYDAELTKRGLDRNSWEAASRAA